MALEREITTHEAALAAERHINFNATLEVRRICWQVAQCCTDGLDRLLYASFVERHIIDHDDVPALKRGTTHCSMYARNVCPFIAPLITMGATIPV